MNGDNVKQIIFDKNTNLVLQWQDTDSFNYPQLLSTQLVMPLTDSEWMLDHNLPWIVNNGSISEYLAPIVEIIPIIDVIGFVAAVKSALGGPAGIMALTPAVQPGISLSLGAISLGDWPDLQIYISTLKPSIDPVAYTAIKAAALTFNIPITLP